MNINDHKKYTKLLIQTDITYFKKLCKVTRRTLRCSQLYPSFYHEQLLLNTTKYCKTQVKQLAASPMLQTFWKVGGKLTRELSCTDYFCIQLMTYLLNYDWWTKKDNKWVKSKEMEINWYWEQKLFFSLIFEMAAEMLDLRYIGNILKFNIDIWWPWSSTVSSCDI